MASLCRKDVYPTNIWTVLKSSRKCRSVLNARSTFGPCPQVLKDINGICLYGHVRLYRSICWDRRFTTSRCFSELSQRLSWLIELSSCRYLISLSLSWNAAYKFTGARVDLLTYIQMHCDFKKWTLGWIALLVFFDFNYSVEPAVSKFS